MSPEVKKRIGELLLLHLMFTTEEGWLWGYYETDPSWWSVRLWTRRN